MAPCPVVSRNLTVRPSVKVLIQKLVRFVSHSPNTNFLRFVNPWVLIVETSRTTRELVFSCQPVRSSFIYNNVTSMNRVKNEITQGTRNNHNLLSHTYRIYDQTTYHYRDSGRFIPVIDKKNRLYCQRICHTVPLVL